MADVGHLSDLEKLEWEHQQSHRKYLVALKHDQERQFDKTLLFLSTGSLYLSFFVKDFSNPPGKVLWLISSWVFFVITILLTLISFWVSAKASENAIELHDKRIKADSPLTGWLSRLRFFSVTCLIGGIVCLTVFYSFYFSKMQDLQPQAPFIKIVREDTSNKKECGCSPVNSGTSPLEFLRPRQAVGSGEQAPE
jgi:hypothetical protein